MRGERKLAPDAREPLLFEDMEPIISVRYPGRLCILGEHCDWAGGASLAVPLAEGITVSTQAGTPGSGVGLSTTLEGEAMQARWPTAGGVDPDGGPLRFVPAALHTLTARGIEVPDVRLDVRSDLPAGRGFSSSAAFTLAVVDALARAAGHSFAADELALMAYHVERTLLGVECGLLDQLACASRHPVLIRWGERADPTFDLKPLSLGADLHLFVGAFRTPRDTRGILAALNRDHRGGGAATRRAFSVFAQGALDASEAMATGDLERLGAVMNEAQTAYERWLEGELPELAAPGLRSACTALRRRGALGAKFSGAGGDGSVVALFRRADDVAEATAALEADHGVVARPLHVTG